MRTSRASDRDFAAREENLNMERWTIREIRAASRDGRLPSILTGREVDRVLKIKYGGNFLPKHCVGNPSGETELFVRIGWGRYRLNFEADHARPAFCRSLSPRTSHSSTRSVPSSQAPQKCSFPGRSGRNAGKRRFVQGLASRIMLNGVAVARLKRLNPPDVTTSRNRASPACVPSARPTSCAIEAGVQIMVEAA